MNEKGSLIEAAFFLSDDSLVTARKAVTALNM